MDGQDDTSFQDGRLAALRLGQSLAAEVPATSAERRAFVSIRPDLTGDDAAAEVDGWKRSDADRTFNLRQDEFRAEHLDGMDYDIGMVSVRSANVRGEPALLGVLAEWGLSPGELDYLRNTDHP